MSKPSSNQQVSGTEETVPSAQELPPGIHMGAQNVYSNIGDIVSGNKTVNFYDRLPTSHYLSKWEHAYVRGILSKIGTYANLFISTKLLLGNTGSHVQPRALPRTNSLFRISPSSAATSSKHQLQPIDDLRDLIRQVQASWVLGPTGVGKTTLIHRLGFTLAQDWIAWFRRRSFKGLLHPSSFYIPDAPQLPIFVRLTSLREDASLRDVIELSWIGTELGGLAKNYLERGKLVIFFDDLDRINDDTRNRIIPELRELISIPGNRYFIATRSEVVTSMIDMPITYMDSLTEGEVQSFLGAYFGPSTGSELYRTLDTQYHEISEWLCIPYVLRVIYELYVLGQQQPPDNLFKLLEDYVQLHLKRQKLSKGEEEAVVKVLKDVAFAQTKYDELPPITDATLKAHPDVESNLPAIQNALKSGLLIGVINPLAVEFPYETIKHYFSSLYLTDLLEQSPADFSALISQSNHLQRAIDLKRAQIGTKDESFDLRWNTPLPPILKSRWHDSFDILVSRKHPSREKLLNILFESDPLMLADIARNWSEDLKGAKAEVRNRLMTIISNSSLPIATRITAGQLLGNLGDPRLGDNSMKPVAGVDNGFNFGTGEYSYQTGVNPFCLDQYPVTNAQFQAFINEKMYMNFNEDLWTAAGIEWLHKLKRTKPTFWEDPRYNKPNYPVVGISWYEAHAYAKWAGKRLPTEKEWEYAATFDPQLGKKYAFPWGSNKFDINFANLMFGSSYVYTTTPVGIYPDGKTNFGVYDLCGNVWEWLITTYFVTPQDDPEMHHDLGTEKCIRGGSWGLSFEAGGICTYRGHALPSTHDRNDIGFRCARDI